MASGSLIRDMPTYERPRERLVQHGADKLRDDELIAIMLRTGMKGVSAIQVAGQLLEKFGNSLEELAKAELEELQQVPAVGRDKAVALKAAFTLARRMAERIVGE